MSSFFAPVYKNAVGVHQNPAVGDNVFTQCFDDPDIKLFDFKEVLIEWDGAAWNEVTTYTPGLSVVALRIDNPCNGTWMYVDYPYNDFRLNQLCCKTCPSPYLNGDFETVVPPAGTVGVPYVYTYQIKGPGPYAIITTSIPAWMTASVNPITGLVTFSGTPTDPGTQPFNVGFANCGGTPTADVDTTFEVVAP